MENQRISTQIDTGIMQFQKEWNILRSLSGDLLKAQIPFKIDGKTMIFAHGLEFPLEKICLTFKWKEEAEVRNFFHYDGNARETESSFKYFDTSYGDMKIRCMFYGGCPDADTDAFLYRNTDLVQIDSLSVPVQSLAFYYENAEKASAHYRMVEEWLKTLQLN